MTQVRLRSGVHYRDISVKEFRKKNSPLKNQISLTPPSFPILYTSMSSQLTTDSSSLVFPAFPALSAALAKPTAISSISPADEGLLQSLVKSHLKMLNIADKYFQLKLNTKPKQTIREITPTMHQAYMPRHHDQSLFPSDYNIPSADTASSISKMRSNSFMLK